MSYAALRRRMLVKFPADDLADGAASGSARGSALASVTGVGSCDVSDSRSLLLAVAAAVAPHRRAAGASGHLPRHVPGARASLAAGRGDVDRARRRAAAGADEPVVAGPLRGARVREERVLRSRRSTARASRSTLHAAERRRVGRRRSRRHGAVVYQHLRRPRRRHLRRRRHDARAPEHAGDVHVGDRASRTSRCAITFVPPAGSNWKVGTQLFPTTDPWTFTAPNLQYFMDSPTELSDFVMSTFSVPNADGTPADFRVVVHGDGSQADVDELAKIVAAARARADGGLRRVSEVRAGLLHVPARLRRRGATATAWSIATARRSPIPGSSLKTPQGRRAGARHDLARVLPQLERRAHPAGRASSRSTSRARTSPAACGSPKASRSTTGRCCWRARGSRTDAAGRAPRIAVINGAGRTVRSAVQMSEYAPFADAATSIDATDRSRTFISYYTYGAAIALALDLSLREMYERQAVARRLHAPAVAALRQAGRARRRAYVGKPYSLKDLRDALAELTSNQAFANDFFDKYIEGREAAGLRDAPARARIRAASGASGCRVDRQRAVTEVPDGLRVGVIAANRDETRVPVAFDTPLYDAGVDEDDVITKIDDQAPTLAAWRAIAQRKPGDTVTLVVRRRDGKLVTTTAKLVADPGVQVVAIETGRRHADRRAADVARGVAGVEGQVRRLLDPSGHFEPPVVRVRRLAVVVSCRLRSLQLVALAEDPTAPRGRGDLPGRSRSSSVAWTIFSPERNHRPANSPGRGFDHDLARRVDRRRRASDERRPVVFGERQRRELDAALSRPDRADRT